MTAAYVNRVRTTSGGVLTYSPTAGNALIFTCMNSIGLGNGSLVSVTCNDAGSTTFTISIPSFTATNTSSRNFRSLAVLPICPAGVTSITAAYNGGSAPGTCDQQIVEISGVPGGLLAADYANQVAPGTTADAIQSGHLGTPGTTANSTVPAYILGIVANDSDGDTVAGTGFTIRGTVDGQWAVMDQRQTSGSTAQVLATAATHGGTDDYTTFITIWNETAAGLSRYGAAVQRNCSGGF